MLLLCALCNEHSLYTFSLQYSCTHSSCIQWNISLPIPFQDACIITADTLVLTCVGICRAVLLHKGPDADTNFPASDYASEAALAQPGAWPEGNDNPSSVDYARTRRTGGQGGWAPPPAPSERPPQRSGPEPREAPMWDGANQYQQRETYLPSPETQLASSLAAKLGAVGSHIVRSSAPAETNRPGATLGSVPSPGTAPHGFAAPDPTLHPGSLRELAAAGGEGSEKRADSVSDWAGSGEGGRAPRGPPGLGGRLEEWRQGVNSQQSPAGMDQLDGASCPVPTPVEEGEQEMRYLGVYWVASR